MRDFEFSVFTGSGNARHWGVAWEPDHPWPARLQTLRWPRGARRWASGYFLATEDQLREIRSKVYRTGSAGSHYHAAALVLDDEDGAKVTTDLFMLPARPVYRVPRRPPGSSPDPRLDHNLFVVCLVDERWLWWHRRGRLEVIEGLSTWDNLFAGVAGLLGISLSGKAIDPDYGKPGLIFNSYYEGLPLVLDVAAWCVGRRVVRKLDGRVVLEDYATARKAADKTRQAPREAGGPLRLTPEADHDLNALVPSAFRFLFPKTVAGTGTPSPEEPWGDLVVRLRDLGLKEYQGAWGNGTTESVRMAAVAMMGSVLSTTPLGGLPSNVSSLEALGRAWARDEYRLRLGLLHVRLWGTAPAEPDALHDVMEWHHLPHTLSTMVTPGPWNEEPPLLSQDPGGGTFPPGQWCSVNLVSNVCPVFDESSGTSGVRYMTGIGVEYVRLTLWAMGCPTDSDFACKLDPEECCPSIRTPPPFPCDDCPPLPASPAACR